MPFEPNQMRRRVLIRFAKHKGKWPDGMKVEQLDGLFFAKGCNSHVFQLKPKMRAHCSKLGILDKIEGPVGSRSNESHLVDGFMLSNARKLLQDTVPVKFAGNFIGH